MKREKKVKPSGVVTYSVSKDGNMIEVEFDNAASLYSMAIHSKYPMAYATKTYNCKVTGGVCYSLVRAGWGESLKEIFDKDGEKGLYAELETDFKEKFHRGLRFVVTPENAIVARTAPASQKECPFCGTKVAKDTTTPWEYIKQTVTDTNLLQRFPEFNGLVFYVAPHADCFPAQLGAIKRGLCASHGE